MVLNLRVVQVGVEHDGAESHGERCVCVNEGVAPGTLPLLVLLPCERLHQAVDTLSLFFAIVESVWVDSGLSLVLCVINYTYVWYMSYTYMRAFVLWPPSNIPCSSLLRARSGWCARRVKNERGRSSILKKKNAAQAENAFYCQFIRSTVYMRHLFSALCCGGDLSDKSCCGIVYCTSYAEI